MPRSLGPLLALALLSGCDALTYEPSGENRVEAGAPVPIRAVELGAPDDTLFTVGRSVLEYTADLDGRHLREARVFVDSVLVGDGRDYGFVPFDVSGVENGLRTLRLVLYTRSGTESLADVLGAELVATEITRPIRIDNGPASPVAITSIGPENGRLLVTWERYDRPNFSAYAIHRSPSGSVLPLATLTDRNTTQWADSFYIGGDPVSYRVATRIQGEGAPGEARSYAAPGPRLLGVEQEGSLEDARIRVTWSATPFYANLDAYTVSRRVEPDGSFHPAFASGSDTTFVDQLDGRLGARYTYRLHSSPYFRPGTPRIPVDGGEREIALDPTVPFAAPLYLREADVLVGRRGSSFVRIDPTTLDVTLSVPSTGRLVASPEGDRLFSAGSTVVRELDPQTLEEIGSLDLTSLYGPTVRMSNLFVAEGGLLFATHNEYRVPTLYGALGVNVIDFDGRASLGQLRADLQGVASVSPDGRYFLSAVFSPDQELYEVTESGLVLLRSDVEPGTLLSGERVLRLDGAVSTYDLFSDALLDRLPIPVSRRYTVDGASGLYAAEAADGSHTAIVFDLETGREHARVPIARDLTFSFAARTLFTTPILSSDGRTFYRRLDLP